VGIIPTASFNQQTHPCTAIERTLCASSFDGQCFDDLPTKYIIGKKTKNVYYEDVYSEFQLRQWGLINNVARYVLTARGPYRQTPTGTKDGPARDDLYDQIGTFVSVAHSMANDASNIIQTELISRSGTLSTNSHLSKMFRITFAMQKKTTTLYKFHCWKQYDDVVYYQHLQTIQTKYEGIKTFLEDPASILEIRAFDSTLAISALGIPESVSGHAFPKTKMIHLKVNSRELSRYARCLSTVYSATNVCFIRFISENLLHELSHAAQATDDIRYFWSSREDANINDWAAFERKLDSYIKDGTTLKTPAGKGVYHGNPFRDDAGKGCVSDAPFGQPDEGDGTMASLYRINADSYAVFAARFNEQYNRKY
jgi:hypothetical protein